MKNDHKLVSYIMILCEIEFRYCHWAGQKTNVYE